VQFELSFNNDGDTSYFVVTARYDALQSTGESFMSSRRRAKISAIGHELHPLVKLWILRMLIPLSSYRQFVKEDGFTNDALAEVLGLEAWINGDNPDFDKREVQLKFAQLTSSNGDAKFDDAVCQQS
jgi:hypothetical protein